MPKRLTWILLSFVVAFSVFANAEEWRKTYAITGKPLIRVETNDAEIRVYSADRKDIETVVTTQRYKIGSGGVEISERQAGDTVELNVHVPDFHIFSFGGHKSVRVEVNIPRQADLDVHSGDGAILAENLNGKATLRSGDGDIGITTGKGSLNLQTSDRHVEGHNLEGVLTAETKDGSIRVDGIFSGLDLHTGDGSIDAEARPGSKMTSSWNLRSGDGNVRLALPEAFSADVDVRTGDGHITVDFPVTVEAGSALRQNAIRGKVNGGGQLLEIKTGDGNVTLNKS